MLSANLPLSEFSLGKPLGFRQCPGLLPSAGKKWNGSRLPCQAHQGFASRLVYFLILRTASPPPSFLQFCASLIGTVGLPDESTIYTPTTPHLLLSLPRPSSPCLCAVISKPTKVACEERSHSAHLPGTCFLERTRACWVASLESDAAPCLPDPSLEMVLGEPDTGSQPPPTSPAFVSGRNKITLGKVQPPHLSPPPGLGYSFPIHLSLPEVGAIARESR